MEDPFQFQEMGFDYPVSVRICPHINRVKTTANYGFIDLSSFLCSSDM